MSAPADLPPGRAVLELVPGCQGGHDPLALECLAGGSVNQTWLVTSREGRFVARILGAAAERLGVERSRERRWQALAATAGLAPAVLAASADGRVLVSEFVAGRRWEATDLERPEAIERLGARLARLQALEVPEALQAPPFDPRRQLERLAAEAIAATPGGRRDIESLVTRAAARLAQARARRRAPSALHLDLHPGNIIEGERLVLLDWEYAGWGDPALEIASLLASQPQVAPGLGRLLDAAALARSVSLEEIGHLGFVFEAVHWLWYRACRLAGEPARADAAAEERLAGRLLPSAQGSRRPPSGAGG